MEATEAETRTSQGSTAPTARVRVSEIDEIDVWTVGEGTPVILIHGAFFGSLLKPLAEELASRGGYQAIWYRRRGYNGRPTDPVPVPEQASDVVKVLDELGIDKAHVVGHSAGGLFALAVAMEAPDRVSSAALFDCILTQVPSAPALAELAKPAITKAQAGDFVGAAAEFVGPLGCTKELMDRVLPGSWSALEQDAPTWFQVDAPVLNQWSPDPARVQALDMPLAWLESGAFPPIHETGELLRKWQPDITVLEIATDNHFFPVAATEEAATVINDWIHGQGI